MKAERARRREGERGRVNVVFVMLALIVLVAVIGTWWPLVHRAAPRAPELPPPDVVERALARAEADSLALKTKWVESVPDADDSGLDAAQHETFVRFLNARFCECGCGYTLGACRNFDPTCPYSGPLVTALLDSIRAGAPLDLEGIRPRPAASEEAAGS